jgi:hypothetical protein
VQCTAIRPVQCAAQEQRCAAQEQRCAAHWIHSCHQLGKCVK